MKDIVHVDAVLPFAAVSLEVKLAQLLLLVRHDVLVFKLALHPLHKTEDRIAFT